MGAVGGEGESGEVGGEGLDGGEVRAVGEGDVVGGEAGLCEGGGGDDEDGAGAEAEEDDGAMEMGKVG